MSTFGGNEPSDLETRVALLEQLAAALQITIGNNAASASADVTAEAGSRADGDSALTALLNAEQAARISGDQALGDQIAALAQAMAAGDAINFDQVELLATKLQQALGETLAFALWNSLAEIDTAALPRGKAAKVYGPDNGVHIDPVSSAEVQNTGVYSALPGTGWARIGNLEIDDLKAQVEIGHNWAEGATPPDTDDPTSKSAKTWAAQAQASAAGYFRVYDFNGLKPIDDTLGAGGTVNAIYCPRASIYTKRNGVQASFTLTNSDSTEWPGYAKLTFSSAHQFFYIDLDDSTFKSVTYSGGLPTYPNLDTMIPIAMAVQGRLIWFVDRVMADDIDRPAIIWAAPLVVEISVTNTILRVPAFYYKEGTGLYTLISPRIPAGFTATPKYTELTFASASATRIWFDYKQYIADPTQAYIKTAVGNVSPITRKFKGVMLAKAFNGAIECAQAVVGDAPGGQVANQFAYSRDITALPIDRYSFLVGSSFYTISNAAVTAMGLTTGVQNTTADKRPSIEWLIPEAHGGCEFFVSIIVDSAVANDFGTPQVATYAGTTVRGSTQTMTLEKQFDQYTARYTLKGLMPNFADIDRIRIVGTNPNSITGLKWAGLQWHHGGGAAPYIRTTDIFGPLPVAARMTLAETSLTDLNKVLTSGSFGARGRPVSNATSTTDLLILGDSKATDGQGFANELAALYPGRSTTKNAVAGQASFETALWAGKPGAVAAAFTLPASGGVTVTLTPNPFIGTPINPSSCKALIDGAMGILSWNGSVITFTRSAAGRSRTIAAGASVQIVSTLDVTGSTASASILHPTALKRTLVVNVGHNDLYLSPWLLNSSGRNGYTRAGFRENLLGIVNAANAANIRALVCGIHNGLKFLTDTRAQANGAGAGIGIAASDAITLAVLEERDANNAWMAATFEGYVDLLAAQKTAGNTVSIDLGSGAVFDVLSITAAPDGIHGTDGATLQTTDAAAIKAVADALSW